MADAMKAMGTKTKREAVEEALRRSVRAAKQMEVWNALRGLGWEGDLDDMRTSKYISDEG